jgi:predicted MFS family arabinose efflux permease
MEGKNKSLLVLFMMNFIGCSGYAMIIPLFPPLAADRGVSDSIVGYIFALSPVGAVIISLILGTNMKIEQMKKV